MKKGIFFLVFIISLRVYSQPVFYVENETLDLGTVIQKSNILGEFFLENRGNETLEFKEVIPYCNCTILSMPDKMEPSTKEKLTFNITPKIDEGDWRTVIKITTNEPKDNIHKLTVKMNVIPLLKFYPSFNEDITLFPEENLDTIIKIKSPANLEFSILAFSSNPSENIILEPITPLGEKIKIGDYFSFKVKSLNPIKLGENYINFRFKTNLEILPIIDYKMKVYVKNYVFAQPEYLEFTLNTKPGLIQCKKETKGAYSSPKKEEKFSFLLDPKKSYKVFGTSNGWYQIQDPLSGRLGWIPWENSIVLDNGYSASTKILSTKNIPFKIKSIKCPEKFSCSYEEKKDNVSLIVYRNAPLENLAEELGNIEINLDHPKQNQLTIPLIEKKILKYQETKEKMQRKLRINPEFKDKKVNEAQPQIKIGE